MKIYSDVLSFALMVLAISLSFAPSTVRAQSNTGTMVDPSVPAGVAPNPSSLESARIAPPTPTAAPSLHKKDDLPKANMKLRETRQGFVPQSPGATPSAVNAPTATPTR